MNEPERHPLYPMVVTDQLDAIRAFYLERLGWTARFDLPQYVQVHPKDRPGMDLAFMAPDAQLPAPMGAFFGDGLLVSVHTPNADDLQAVLEDRGVTIETPAADRPWGWRSFVVRDPVGVRLDFFHVIP
jgi:predicted enzyme related to lactoylglutathione lyase